MMVKIPPAQVNETEALLASIKPGFIESKRMTALRLWPRFFYTTVTVQAREDAFLLLVRELSQRIGSYVPLGNEAFL
jgi:hypothetical protein